MVEHSTADREVGGSIPLAPCLRIVGRVKQPVLFLEIKHEKSSSYIIGKKNIMAKYFTKLLCLVRPAPLKGTCNGLGNFHVFLDIFLRR